MFASLTPALGQGQIIKKGLEITLASFHSSPAAKPRYGALPCFQVLSFFLMDSVSLGIADDQTESWNFVSVEQFKI